jgi:hypothetical protein
MNRSSSVRRLEVVRARDVVVIPLPVERRRYRLWAAVADERVREGGVVLVTLALVALLLAGLRHAVQGPVVGRAAPPAVFGAPLAP